MAAVDLTAAFDYELPEDAIAQEAIEPRDAARLLLVPSMQDRRVSDLPELLQPGDLLVVNRTRVRAARLRGQKQGTGGQVEVLLLGNGGSGRWRALCRPARRLREGTTIEFSGVSAEIVDGPDRGIVTLDFGANGEALDEVLPQIGEIPLPPYFHGRLPSPDRYQTIFADTVGSAAAPTAGLHFTAGLLESLRLAGIELAAVDLEVGLDTFRPISEERIADHHMHTERYEVPHDTVAAMRRTRDSGGRVVAVGTTVVRSLESSVGEDGPVAGRGETSLFITPGYRFRAVDCVLTNFHAPRTTLAVMAAAMIGTGWRDVYRHALARGYRFLSFGDAMFIERVGVQ